MKRMIHSGNSLFVGLLCGTCLDHGVLLWADLDFGFCLIPVEVGLKVRNALRSAARR
jgi:hypothetical protein